MQKNLLWAGTEDSLVSMIERVKGVADLKAYAEGAVDVGGSSILSVHGNVGVISIRGSLVNTDLWYNELIGAVSYNQISNALVEAAELPEVHSIVLDIDSPGGYVSGVSDTADLIKYIDSSIKPVYAYTSGTMCSGAYWLGSSAREIYAARIANIGSIGVITTSIDISKQLDEAGIKATVIRAGKYKQMGNMYEELTEEGKRQIQSMVDDVYKIFVGDVASNRNKSYAYTDEYMAQGRVMLSESAKTVGLIDGIMSFDQALINISKRTLDKRNLSFEHTNNNLGATMKQKKSLVGAVYQDLFQVSAGKITASIDTGKIEKTVDTGKIEKTIDTGKITRPIDTVSLTSKEPKGETVQAQETMAEETVTQVGEDLEQPSVDETQNNNLVILDDGTVVDVEAQEAVSLESNTQEEVEVKVSEDKAQVNEGVSEMFKLLSAKDDQIVDLRISLEKVKAELEEFKVMEASLKEIIAKSAQGMQVALGQPRSDYSQSSLKSVLEAHASVSATFNKSFKAGQRSVTNVNTDESPNKDQDKPKSFKDLTALQRASATVL
ncbi:signal peptide peptidase SppA [Oligella urethralis]|uniref:signal peptide peptidase SppA n=1 Tax=Oligella urethralis TaxID=90245 RepID=UPI0006614316|nr:signal peptide peptidase SppA [Oligella urethralis]